MVKNTSSASPLQSGNNRAEDFTYEVASRFPPRESRVDTAGQKFQCEIKTKVLLEMPTASHIEKVKGMARKLDCDWDKDDVDLRKISLRRTIMCQQVWDPDRTDCKAVEEYLSFSKDVSKQLPDGCKQYPDATLATLKKCDYDIPKAKASIINQQLDAACKRQNYEEKRRKFVRKAVQKLHDRAKKELGSRRDVEELDNLIQDYKDELARGNKSRLGSINFIKELKSRADIWKKNALKILGHQGGGTFRQVEELVHKADTMLPLLELEEYKELKELRDVCRQWIDDIEPILNGTTKVISLTEARRRLNAAKNEFPQVVVPEVSQLRDAVQLVTTFNSSFDFSKSRKRGHSRVSSRANTPLRLHDAQAWLRQLDTRASFINVNAKNDMEHNVEQASKFAKEVDMFVRGDGDGSKALQTKRKIMNLLAQGTGLKLQTPQMESLRRELESFKWLEKYQTLYQKATNKGRRGPWLPELEELVEDACKSNPPIKEKLVKKLQQRILRAQGLERRAKRLYSNKKTTVSKILALLEELKSLRVHFEAENQLLQIVKKSEGWEAQVRTFFAESNLLSVGGVIVKNDQDGGEGREILEHSISLSKAQQLFQQQSQLSDIRLSPGRDPLAGLLNIVKVGKDFRTKLNRTLKSLESKNYKEREQKERKKSLVQLRRLMVDYGTRYLSSEGDGDDEDDSIDVGSGGGGGEDDGAMVKKEQNKDEEGEESPAVVRKVVKKEQPEFKRPAPKILKAKPAAEGTMMKVEEKMNKKNKKKKKKRTMNPLWLLHIPKVTHAQGFLNKLDGLLMRANEAMEGKTCVGLKQLKELVTNLNSIGHSRQEEPLRSLHQRLEIAKAWHKAYEKLLDVPPSSDKSRSKKRSRRAYRVNEDEDRPSIEELEDLLGRVDDVEKVSMMPLEEQQQEEGEEGQQKQQQQRDYSNIILTGLSDQEESDKQIDFVKKRVQKAKEWVKMAQEALKESWALNRSRELLEAGKRLKVYLDEIEDMTAYVRRLEWHESAQRLLSKPSKIQELIDVLDRWRQLREEFELTDDEDEEREEVGDSSHRHRARRTGEQQHYFARYKQLILRIQERVLKGLQWVEKARELFSKRYGARSTSAKSILGRSTVYDFEPLYAQLPTSSDHAGEEGSSAAIISSSSLSSSKKRKIGSHEDKKARSDEGEGRGDNSKKQIPSTKKEGAGQEEEKDASKMEEDNEEEEEEEEAMSRRSSRRGSARIEYRNLVVAATKTKKKKQTIEKELGENEQLFCYCQEAYQDGQFMMECESCQEWFHPICLNSTKQEATRRLNISKKFYCPSCSYKLKTPFMFRDKVPSKRRIRSKGPSFAEVEELFSQSPEGVISMEYLVVGRHLQHARKWIEQVAILLRSPSSSSSSQQQQQQSKHGDDDAAAADGESKMKEEDGDVNMKDKDDDDDDDDVAVEFSSPSKLLREGKVAIRSLGPNTYAQDQPLLPFEDCSSNRNNNNNNDDDDGNSNGETKTGALSQQAQSPPQTTDNVEGDAATAAKKDEKKKDVDEEEKSKIMSRLDDVEVLQSFHRKSLSIPMEIPAKDMLEDHIRMMLRLEKARRILALNDNGGSSNNSNKPPAGGGEGGVRGGNASKTSTTIAASKKKKMVSFKELIHVFSELQSTKEGKHVQKYNSSNRDWARFSAFVKEAGEWVAASTKVLERERHMIYDLIELQEIAKSKFPCINFDSLHKVASRVSNVKKWMQKEQKAINNKDTLAKLRKLILQRRNDCGDTVSHWTLRIEVEIERAAKWSDRLADAIKEKAPKHVFQDLIDQAEFDRNSQLLVEADDLEHAKSFVTRYCLCQSEWVDGVFMIGCDECDEWYHPKCINMTQEQADKQSNKSFQCPKCCIKKKIKYKFGDAKEIIAANKHNIGEGEVQADSSDKAKKRKRNQSSSLPTAKSFIETVYNKLSSYSSSSLRNRNLDAATCKELWGKLSEFYLVPINAQLRQEILTLAQDICGADLVQKCLKKQVEDVFKQSKKGGSGSSGGAGIDSGGGEEAKIGKKASRKRSNKPKDYPVSMKTPYKCFVAEFKRLRGKELTARAKNEGKTIAQVTGEMWRQLLPDMKGPYYELAKEDKHQLQQSHHHFTSIQSSSSMEDGVHGHHHNPEDYMMEQHRRQQQQGGGYYHDERRYAVAGREIMHYDVNDEEEEKGLDSSERDRYHPHHRQQQQAAMVMYDRPPLSSSYLGSMQQQQQQRLHEQQSSRLREEAQMILQQEEQQRSYQELQQHQQHHPSYHRQNHHHHQQQQQHHRYQTSAEPSSSSSSSFVGYETSAARMQQQQRHHQLHTGNTSVIGVGRDVSSSSGNSTKSNNDDDNNTSRRGIGTTQQTYFHPRRGFIHRRRPQQQQQQQQQHSDVMPPTGQQQQQQQQEEEEKKRHQQPVTSNMMMNRPTTSTTTPKQQQQEEEQQQDEQQQQQQQQEIPPKMIANSDSDTKLTAQAPNQSDNTARVVTEAAASVTGQPHHVQQPQQQRAEAEGGNENRYDAINDKERAVNDQPTSSRPSSIELSHDAAAAAAAAASNVGEESLVGTHSMTVDTAAAATTATTTATTNDDENNKNKSSSSSSSNEDASSQNNSNKRQRIE
eukprot:jgi/Bigna1/77954/fgenesh1_pg.51_\